MENNSNTNTPIAKIDTSAWPSSIDVTRSEVTFTFLKSDPKRENKKGQTLPYYSVDLEKEDYSRILQFIGEKVLRRWMQAKLDYLVQFIMRDNPDVLSKDKSRIDTDALVRAIERYEGRTEGVAALKEQLANLVREFAEKMASGTMQPSTMQEIGGKMRDLQARIDEKAARAASRADDEDED